MGRPLGGRRLTQVGKLTERGKEALHRLFSAQKGIDVARDLSMSPIHLSKVKNSDVGKAYMAGLEAKRQQGVDEVVRRLAELEVTAVEVLEATLQAAVKKDGNGNLADVRDRVKACPLTSQIRCAERLLERQGYSQPSRATVLHQHLGTGQVLANLKQRHAEIEAEERKKIEQAPKGGGEQDGDVIEEASSGLDTEESNL